ncbi:hypothetical protein SK128_007667, partial [Halocaridina rubra]
VQLSADVKRLQNLSDVTELQLKQNRLLHSSNLVEIEQLRKEVDDLAALSDERSKIGKTV